MVHNSDPHCIWKCSNASCHSKNCLIIVNFVQVLVQFLRQSDEVLFWINDKEAFVNAEDFGHDLEHVEVLQRKFDEFLKDMATQEYR